MMSKTVTYHGFLAERSWGEADDILFITGRYDPLASEIADDLSQHGHYCTVRYFVAEKEATAEELVENLVRSLAGQGNADFGSRYSEITGYLWTDEEIVVGGHDLLKELRSYLGKFCLLEITYSEGPPS